MATPKKKKRAAAVVSDPLPVEASGVLSKIVGIIQLAALVEGNVLPIVIGTVTEVKALLQGQTITYTVAIQTGLENLDSADASFQQSLEKINQERRDAGLPPLSVPTPPPAPEE